MGTFREKLANLGRRTPWWGISLLVHAIVVVILMHWRVPARPPEIEVEAIRIAELRPKEPEPPPLDLGSPVLPEPPAKEPSIEKAELKELVDAPALAAAEKMGETAVISVEGSLYAGRSPGGRKAAIEQGGPGSPTEGSESAVEAGLIWLSRKQLDSGGWRGETEGARWLEPGISGLATLAFLGGGYTHKGGKFLRVVDKALRYLKSHQGRDGCIAVHEDGKRLGEGRVGYMYCHAIGALALIEAYGMTNDPLLQEPAQRAVDFICQTQNDTGGWRYYAKTPQADTSVSGWMVMALRSASLSGLDVPSKTFDNARRFFDSMTDKAEGKTRYMGALPMGMALHAVGLLCHQYLGMAADDPYIDRASALINANPPKWLDRGAVTPLPLDQMALFTSTNNYYYWYYAGLALHQRRGKAWEEWYPRMRELLCQVQERKGDNQGSWPPLTYGGSIAGRVYSTALAVLSLEVPYRYLPLYREKVDEVLAAFGDALAAYNHFVRQHQAKNPDAEGLRKKAVEKLNHFLALSESRTEKSDPKKTAERRGQAATMLVALHRAGGDLVEAIALLKTFPERFPDLMKPGELVQTLADLHRALGARFAAAGEADKAKQAVSIALNLYYPILTKSLGKNPELELWAAGGFYEREQWQKALDLYKPQLDRVNLKRLDPKSEQGKVVVAILDRLVKCSTNLKLYKTAQRYLDQLERLVGQTLATRRLQAELYRLQDNPTGARRIYDALLPRLPEYGPEWWDIKHEQLFMAYLEGRNDEVVKAILTLQLYHPDLGGDALRPRFLDLLGRAQEGKPTAKPLPESPLR